MNKKRDMQSDMGKAIDILRKSQSLIASIPHTSEDNDTLRIVDNVSVSLRHVEVFLASVFRHINSLPDKLERDL